MSLDKLTFQAGDFTLEMGTQLSYHGPNGLRVEPALPIDIVKNQRKTSTQFAYDSSKGTFVRPEENRDLTAYTPNERTRIVLLLAEAAETYALLHRSGMVQTSILK
ncbi:hypothetical protein J4219_03790 [Candidatus Woesearchaeota archaeon]|nr:hypothetical protein [Candidatus Woesearchaeota archaeon]